MPGVSAVMFVRMTEDDLQKRSARPTDEGLDAVEECVCVCVRPRCKICYATRCAWSHSRAIVPVTDDGVQSQTDVLIQEPVPAYKHV